MFSIEEFKDLKLNDSFFIFNSIGRIIEGKSESKEKKIIEKFKKYKILYDKQKTIFNTKSDTVRLVSLMISFKFWTWANYWRKLRNNWIHNLEFENFLEDYVHYIKYLDKDNLKDFIYFEIFNQIGRSIKFKEIDIRMILNALKSEEFLIVDKDYEKKNGESVFDFLEKIDDEHDRIKTNLLEIHINEFKLFSYRNLDFHENVIYLSNQEFLDMFINDVSRKYSNCEKNINSVLDSILQSSTEIDKELKESFERLLQKLKKLQNYFGIEEQITFVLKDNLKGQVLLHKFSKGKKTLNGLKKWMDTSKIIDDLLMKSLREDLYSKLKNSKKFNNLDESYIKYYNKKINELINIVPKDFYKSIIISLGNFHHLNKKLILNREIIDVLLDNTTESFINSINPLVVEYYKVEEQLGKLKQEKENNIAELNKKYSYVYSAINDLIRRFLFELNEKYKLDLSENRYLSGQEIKEFLKIIEEDEFDSEMDNISINELEKSCSDENRELFKMAVPLGKRQTKIEVKYSLLYKNITNIDNEIAEMINVFFEKTNLINNNLWELVYSSLNSYSFNKNSKFGVFLIKYNSNKNKENN